MHRLSRWFLFIRHVFQNVSDAAAEEAAKDTVVAGVWIPVAAQLTPANTGDGEVARELLREVPAQVRFVLGDQHDNREELRADCPLRDGSLVTSRLGKYPHKDAGAEVRRVFHRLRTMASENLNEHFKGILDVAIPLPSRKSAAAPLARPISAGTIPPVSSAGIRRDQQEAAIITPPANPRAVSRSHFAASRKKKTRAAPSAVTSQVPVVAMSA